MLTIRRRRSTSLRHRRPALAKSSGSRRDPKQLLACSWFTPATKCKLRLLKLDRVKDYLLMEEEFVAGQERLKPQEDKNEEDWSEVDDLRGFPMSVGNLEEIIDENHAIVSSSVGPEYYVNVLGVCETWFLNLKTRERRKFLGLSELWKRRGRRGTTTTRDGDATGEEGSGDMVCGVGGRAHGSFPAISEVRENFQGESRGR